MEVMSTPCLLILLFFHLLDPQTSSPPSLVPILSCSSTEVLSKVSCGSWKSFSPLHLPPGHGSNSVLRAFCRGSLSSQCPLGHSSGLWSKASSLANCCFTWHISLNYLHNYLSLLEGTVRNGIQNYFSITLSLWKVSRKAWSRVL